MQRHIAAGDRRGAGAAIGLQHIAVDADLALAERGEIGDGAQAAADQPLDFLGAAALPAARRLAVGAGCGRARQHAVFGGDPALAGIAQKRRHPLRRFYARRARRLLPLSAILLASVGVLSLVLLSPVRAVEVSGDIVSSALYTANWHFAAQSVDYFAQDIEPSPVLHLWSLAIEEQFYVVWPSLLLAVTWFWRRRGDSVRPAIWVTLAVVLVGSFALGVKLTADQPAAAYFSTFGRAWELGLGRGAGAARGAAHPPRRGGGDRLGRPRARSSTRRSPSTRARRSPGPPPCCRPSAPPA